MKRGTDMNYNDKKVSDIKLAYIGGGSMGWAWTFMADLSLDDSISGTIRLYDINEPAAVKNEIIGNLLSDDPNRIGSWRYETVNSLKDALTGADFIIISILPGTFNEMYSDVHAPEKYGIYQSVGDTAGPGGLMRALRSIPMFVEIAEAVKKYAPNAWVINYTNPLALCVRTLYRIYPGIKAFGCCHEVFNTQKLLALMCMEKLGVEKITRREIVVNVMGLNHFTWFDRASYEGYDLFPMYREFVDEYYETGYPRDFDGYLTDPFASAHRVKFDLFRKYGLIAAAGDRHLAEFMPPIYLKDPQTVACWKFALTPVKYRIEDLHSRQQKSSRLISGEEQLYTEPSDEEGILLIKSLLGLERTISNVNVPNTGQIANLPLGTIVETNALFERDHIAPVYTGSLPYSIKALIDPHVRIQEDILNSALTCDRELAFKAFCEDPLMTIKEDDARRLFEEMLQNIRNYLPEGWFLKTRAI